MISIGTATLFGTAVGVIGTGAGGLLAYAAGTGGKRAMSVLLQFSAGMMLSVVCFDLLPHAYSLAPMWVALGGAVAGVGFVFLSQTLLAAGGGGRRGSIWLSAVSMVVSIALHNFPEGLAVGAGFDESIAFGLSLGLAIFLHDLPEGLSEGLLLRMSGRSAKYTAVLAALSGLPTGGGAALGAALGGVSDTVICACLGLAAGAMLFVVLSDMLPESGRLWPGRAAALGGVAGILTGMVMSLLLH